MIGLDNPLHLAILFLILLLVFGAKRLPELGRSLGSGLRGFKEAITGADPEPSPQLVGSFQPPDVTSIESDSQPLRTNSDGVKARTSGAQETGRIGGTR